MEPKSFEDAHKDCQHKGGNLALPTSEETNTAVVDLARTEYKSAIEDGATELNDKNIPIWINVQTDENSNPPADLVYDNWIGSGPNGKHNECVRIDTKGNDEYLWNDKDCKNKFPYVCQFRGKRNTMRSGSKTLFGEKNANIIRH